MAAAGDQNLFQARIRFLTIYANHWFRKNLNKQCGEIVVRTCQQNDIYNITTKGTSKAISSGHEKES